MHRRRAVLAAAALAIALAAAPPAQADLVVAQGAAPGVAAAPPVFEDVQFITSGSTLATGFSVASGGRYTVTLTDFLFPSAFQTLALAITSATSTLATLDGPGSLDLVLDGPMQLYALVFGVPDPALGVGLYGVRVALAEGGGGEVPLPAGAWLLLGALATLVGPRLRRARAAP